tara:strand:+ start:458 stop:1147 length:690 start_codon:yes stop_codon:yes gene_type:complete
MLSKNKIEEIIRGSTQKAKQQKKEFIMFNRILVRLLQNTLVSFDEVIDKIEKTVPSYLFDEIDEIFVGSFNENDSRALEAHYESGAIYVTNDIPTVMDYVENIIHETAHSVEQSTGLLIYGDKKIEAEFLGKRDTLKRIFDANKFNTSGVNFRNAEYSEVFDLYLYKEVGYEKMDLMTSGLFYSPYAATSISEYFANGFEKFFLEDREHLKRISPRLTAKIWEILGNEI